MLIKSIYLKVLITTLTLSGSITALANETKFKIAVIKKEVGNESSTILAFNKNMNSCVELIKAKKINESEITCSAAIENIKLIKTDTPNTKYIESLSYSNRAISRYLNHNLSGAKDDLITAILIDSNAITKSNLKLIKQRSLVAESTNATEFSD